MSDCSTPNIHYCDSPTQEAEVPCPADGEPEQFSGTITFQTLASFDVYDIGLVQQCLMLGNQFMTNITMDCFREPNNAQQIVATSCSRLLKIDRDLAVQRAAEHPSLKCVLEVTIYLAKTVGRPYP